MKSRLSTDNINDLRIFLSSQNIKGRRVTENLSAYSKESPHFKDVLRWLEKSLLQERSGILTNFRFEPSPFSINGETGLFYLEKIDSSPVGLLLGFDNHSREWVIGDIDTWRKETQKAAFEDNWKRWIVWDFIEEVERIFSAGIEEDMTEIRRLFDFASHKAGYVCPRIEAGDDCYCPIETIVQSLDYNDLRTSLALSGRL
jgi:hypothetical protein